MIDWWNGMQLIQQIFAVIAIPATVILIIQTILLLFGLGQDHETTGGLHDLTPADSQDMPGVFGHDVVDTHGHESHEIQDSTAEAGLRLLTVRGLVAFFAIGGWAGVVMIDLGLHPVLASLIALATGLGALFLVAWLIKLMLSLQDSGNLDIRNAVGLIGDVYLRIPGSMQGSGKITIILQGRSIELDALTDDPNGIMTGRQARVVETRGDRLVVRPID
jgi:hypothetical protein